MGTIERGCSNAPGAADVDLELTGRLGLCRGWLAALDEKVCVFVGVSVGVGEVSSIVASTVTAGLRMYGRAELVIRRRKRIACVDSQDL